MKTKILLASSLCLLLVSWTAPSFNNSPIALTISIDKEGTPPGQAAGTPNSDAFVSDQVRQAFVNDAKFAREMNNVSVETQNGKVTLTGQVTSEAMKKDFQQKAENVPGVKSVDNKLEISK